MCNVSGMCKMTLTCAETVLCYMVSKVYVHAYYHHTHTDLKVVHHIAVACVQQLQWLIGC